jgi:lipoprotein-releasing system ATP-binding protein
MSVLVADKIRKTYKTDVEDVHVLSSVSLNVSQGEIVSIYGPSGAGKSTLLNVLGTLDTFDSGSLTINNIDVKSNLDNALVRRVNLGFVFQFHHLLPEFTVLENLLIPQMLLKIDNEEANLNASNLLKTVGMLKRKNHYPDQISGGEKQRVAVLRAIINKPSIVLADEPTGNLDTENSKLLLELFEEMNKKFNQTFIIATHDDNIGKISNRSLILDKGTLTK